MKTNEILSLDRIGSLISESESTLLKRNFKIKYPNHKSFISIDKSILQKVINSDPNICGVKFLYGMSSMMEPSSKFIMLIPCLASTDHSNPIPKLTADGFFTSDGNRIELVNAWEALCNYVKCMRSHDLDLCFEDVSRYCYFGKASLNILLSIENVEQIEYHFGYDDFTDFDNKCSKYRIVLQPCTYEKVLDIYMDHGGLVPHPGGPLELGGKTYCLVKTAIGNINGLTYETEVDLFRSYRNQLLSNEIFSDSTLEMYYQASEALVDKIDRNYNKKEIYLNLYKSMISTSEFLKDQSQSEIKKIVSDKLIGLINLHLLN